MLRSGTKNLLSQLTQLRIKRLVTLISKALQTQTWLKVLGITTSLLNKPFNPEKHLKWRLIFCECINRRRSSLDPHRKISFDEKSNTLLIKLSEGLISKIIIEGNTKTKDRIITREFPLKAGDLFKYDLAEKGLTNLRSTNLFDQIDLTIVPMIRGERIKTKC